MKIKKYIFSLLHRYIFFLFQINRLFNEQKKLKILNTIDGLKLNTK